MSETISVYWPSGGTLSPEEWRQRLECLATRAEGLVGRRDAPVQQRAAMAMEWMGLCWPSLSPEVVAGSCRASLLLNEPVVVAAAPADQLAEIHESLDEIWELARVDPAAAAVSIGPPLLERVRARGGRARRPPDAAAAAVEPEPLPSPAPAPAPPEPAAAAAEPSADPDPDELPPEWQQPLEPAPSPASKPLRDRALRMAARPEPPAQPDPDPEPLPSPADPVPDVIEVPVPEPAVPAVLDVEVPVEVPPVPDAAVPPVPEPPAVRKPTQPKPSPAPEGFNSAPELAAELGVRPTAVGGWAVRHLEPDDVFRSSSGSRVWFRRDAVIGTYVPRSERPRKPAPVRSEPPDGWFSTAETIALLGCGSSSIGRWRRAGRFGLEGDGWRLCSGVFFFSPESVEKVLAEQQPADLDSLIDEIRAEQ